MPFADLLQQGKFMQRLSLLPVILVLLASGCGTSRTTPADIVTVEGVVSVRGNEPFTELVLETADRNHYVLKFESEEERTQVQDQSPAPFEVSGEVYEGVWGSRPFAHLRVQTWSRPAR